MIRDVDAEVERRSDAVPEHLERLLARRTLQLDPAPIN